MVSAGSRLDLVMKRDVDGTPGGCQRSRPLSAGVESDPLPLRAHRPRSTNRCPQLAESGHGQPCSISRARSVRMASVVGAGNLLLSLAKATGGAARPRTVCSRGSRNIHPIAVSGRLAESRTGTRASDTQALLARLHPAAWDDYSFPNPATRSQGWCQSRRRKVRAGRGCRQCCRSILASTRLVPCFIE